MNEVKSELDSGLAALRKKTPTPPRPGIGISLSGGGYRAMLFHVGALWRLNEVGLLTRAARISSVSGGSITAGWLALLWAQRGWGTSAIPENEFRDVFAAGLRQLARCNVDIPSVLRGFAPWHNVGQEVARCYDRVLFRGATLQNLPDTPRFVFNASNLQSGALWRFSKPYMGDYKVGRIHNPDIQLAIAVAASSAFPPFLSPMELNLDPTQYKLDGSETLHREPFNTRPVLSDGGVYDNLGLETIFKEYDTVLVSDAGAPFNAKEAPSRVWPWQLKRVLDCIDNQVRSLRKRDLMNSFAPQQGKCDNLPQRKGTYWGIGTSLRSYNNACGLSCSAETTLRLARTPTRLARMNERLQEEFINWGYAACAASVASYFPQQDVPSSLPYPRAPLT